MTPTRAEPIVWPERWQDLPPGGVIPGGGNSVHYETGGWRNDRPVWHEDVSDLLDLLSRFRDPR